MCYNQKNGSDHKTHFLQKMSYYCHFDFKLLTSVSNDKCKQWIFSSMHKHEAVEPYSANTTGLHGVDYVTTWD